MRYWTMLPGGEVAGPLEPAQIAENEAFGPETLVCSEHFSGDGDHAWIRAGFIGELRNQLPRALRIIPPDPTLAEAAAIGSLEKRVLELESLLLDALDRLRERTRDVHDLELDSREREREVLKLQTALKRISSRVGNLGGLDAQLRRMTNALEVNEKNVGSIRNSFEQGLEEAARTAAKTVAEALHAVQEATKIAEKATAIAAGNKKRRRKKRKRTKKKKSGPDPFAI